MYALHIEIVIGNVDVSKSVIWSLIQSLGIFSYADSFN